MTFKLCYNKIYQIKTTFYIENYILFVHKHNVFEDFYSFSKKFKYGWIRIILQSGFVNFKFPTRNSIITVISFLHNCSVYLTMLWFRIRAQTHNPIKTKEERGVHHLFMVVTVWLQQANCEWSLLVLSVYLLQIVYTANFSPIKSMGNARVARGMYPVICI